MSEPPAPVGLVLAGGDSKRFGADKGNLEIDGQTMVSLAVSRLDSVCSEVAVAGGGRRYPTSVESIEDGPGKGPAAGILGAARAFDGRPLLVLACDLPGVTEPLLSRLHNGSEYDWFLPRHRGGVEPLCARYSPAILELLERQVATGVFALHTLLTADLEIGFLENEELQRLGSPAELFLNVNEPEDLACLTYRCP